MAAEIQKGFMYVNKEIMNTNHALFFVNRAGLHDVPPDFYVTRNGSYPYCLLQFILSGSGNVIYKNKKYPVKSGEFALLNAYEPHQYMATPEDPFSLYWMEFSGANCSDLVGTIIENLTPVICPPTSDMVLNYIKKIFRFLNDSPVRSSVLISQLLYSMLSNLFYAVDKNRYNAICGETIEKIQDTILYINNHIHEELNIEKISKISSFSPTHFAKTFHKVTGITPARYIQQKRLNTAKELLCNTDRQIEQISGDLGFCNPSHFIRLFKMNMGMTPTEYRKQSMVFKLSSKK